MEIQSTLKNNGINFIKEANENSPDTYVSAMLADPDGNRIRLDQM